MLGVFTGFSRLGEELLDSPLQLLRALPFLSLVPLFMVWFGIGEEARVILIAVATTFPMYVSTAGGVRAVDQKLVEAMRSFGLSLHSTSLGKVLLAWDRPRTADIADLGPLRPLTNRTIVDPDRLAAELACVRKVGYALNDGESALGVRTVSVPILDRGGRARFALAVRATPEVMPESKIQWVLAQARACVAAIQVHLLFPEDRPAQADQAGPDMRTI